VCLLVEDLDAALAEMKARGVKLIDETPRVGAGGCRVAFVHPKAAAGVLVELKEVTA
jgi:methylmalonyl-CoA epimerase